MMIRAPFCDKDYWDRTIDFNIKANEEALQQIQLPSGNPSARPQYVYQIAQRYLHLMFRCYSRGDDLTDLAQYFPPLLDAWEESIRLEKDFRSDVEIQEMYSWALHLHRYTTAFWLVSMALALDIPEKEWKRLLALIGNEGEDILLDRIIAVRQHNRKIGTILRHPKPYQRLLEVNAAPLDKQAILLSSFVENWYIELNELPRNEAPSKKTTTSSRPYWCRYGEQNMEGGAYFGQWCAEAVAAVKAFGFDDSLCLGHPNYPGDLLRPGSVTPPDMKRLPRPLKEWLKAQEQDASLSSAPIEKASLNPSNSILDRLKKLLGN